MVDKREWVEKERELMSQAAGVSSEVRYKLCDMGY